MHCWRYLGRTDDEFGVIDHYVAPARTPGPRAAAQPNNRHLVAHFLDAKERFDDDIPQYWLAMHPSTSIPILRGGVTQPVERAYLNELSAFHDPRGTNAHPPELVMQDRLMRQFRKGRFSPTRQ
jgi:hypothetical protein